VSLSDAERQLKLRGDGVQWVTVHRPVRGIL